jgi:hypothetical protein
MHVGLSPVGSCAEQCRIFARDEVGATIKNCDELKFVSVEGSALRVIGDELQLREQGKHGTKTESEGKSSSCPDS